MIYWADLLYEKPEDDLSAYEGVLENTAEAIDGAGDAPPPVPRTPQEAAFLQGLRAQMTAFSDAELATTEPPPVPAEPQGALERVPLPWFIKKRFLNAYLRDVHHYLFDVELALPGKSPVRIQQTIRKRFAEALDADSVSSPHIVVSHSMGTVIAYDCLKRVGDCLPVDGLITLGSPLGVDEIQDRLQPGWTRDDGFPHEKVRGDWVNLFRPARSVCGFDPKLANDYRKVGSPRSRMWRCRTTAPGGTRRRSIFASPTSVQRCAACLGFEGLPMSNVHSQQRTTSTMVATVASAATGAKRAETQPPGKKAVSPLWPIQSSAPMSPLFPESSVGSVGARLPVVSAVGTGNMATSPPPLGVISPFPFWWISGTS